ncbi:hypothetical protein OG792_33765 [Micromonospora sp. NBC_01699]|uniref:hypothetical protein n=1 Tax=Micromonospora sp. NBC_01699 TaxID=2975984 RepID=UPI002E2E6CCB|nr:hypothetical protein [Micromonospora sp. NBC_01699]
MDYRDWGRGDLTRPARRPADAWVDDGDPRPGDPYSHTGEGYEPTSRRRGAHRSDPERYTPSWALESAAGARDDVARYPADPEPDRPWADVGGTAGRGGSGSRTADSGTDTSATDYWTAPTGWQGTEPSGGGRRRAEPDDRPAGRSGRHADDTDERAGGGRSDRRISDGYAPRRRSRSEDGESTAGTWTDGGAGTDDTRTGGSPAGGTRQRSDRRSRDWAGDTPVDGRGEATGTSRWSTGSDAATTSSGGRRRRTAGSDRSADAARWQRFDDTGVWDRSDLLDQDPDKGVERADRAGPTARGGLSAEPRRADRTGRSERAGRTERPERANRTEPTGRTGRADRTEPTGRTGRGDRAERTRAERASRAERPTGESRAGRADRAGRPDLRAVPGPEDRVRAPRSDPPEAPPDEPSTGRRSRDRFTETGQWNRVTDTGERHRAAGPGHRHRAADTGQWDRFDDTGVWDRFDLDSRGPDEAGTGVLSSFTDTGRWDGSTDTGRWDGSTDTGQWDRFTDTGVWDRSELAALDDPDRREGAAPPWRDRDAFWSGTRLAGDDPRWMETPTSAPRSPAVAYPRPPRTGPPRTPAAPTTGARTAPAVAAQRRTGRSVRNAPTAPPGPGNLPGRSSRPPRRIEEDLLAAEPGSHLAAVLYTAAWYAVPVLVFFVWLVTLDNSVPDGCVTDPTGGGCDSQRAQALASILGAAPRFGAALTGSLVVALLLRWVSRAWRPASLGLASAVVGGGLSTVLYSVITGQQLG